ncbi:uncharacterized protein [Amphiura filiformis]|uniref:uncharacterized protein isoform X2 n=1 Tax=Amphiura filiformis TaxID=82378 RepID=UPI003B2117EB
MASGVAKVHRYMGETKNQLRNGYGVYRYPNSFFRYEGDWKEGKKHGHGKLIMNDGSYYEGEFINGEIEGHGFRKWATSGNTYSGQFLNGELNGHGVMTYGDGSVYEGEFQNNRKQGRGVIKDSTGAVYEGSFHNNMKHGEGSMTYSNGDRYVGDWIQDKRQGSGELTSLDGTVYDGQWRNDLFNGEGTMIHSSGMTYDGMWTNGHPSEDAAEIVIIGDTEVDLTQGTPFDVDIEIRTSDGKLVLSEQARELHISAAFRHYTPNENSPLFDLIEEMEETPMTTPFGYEVVPYPLTDFIYMEDRLKTSETPGIKAPSPTSTMGESVALDGTGPADDGSVMSTNKSESSNMVNAEKQPTSVASSTQNKGGSSEVKGESKSDNQGAKDDASRMTTAQGESRPTTEAADGDVPQEGSSRAPEYIDSPVPPPVNNKRTDGAKASFKDMILPGVSEHGRPYAPSPIKSLPSAKSSVSPGGGGKDVGAKKNKGKQGKASKGTKHTEGLDDYPDQVVLKEKDPKAYKAKREKLYGDERFARPAEYVIMVSDVTNPPFLGKKLPTAYMLIKIAHPKKFKKAKTPTKGSKASSRASNNND